MTPPRLLVIGSSGFVGRHLLDHLKQDYRIAGLARRSQSRCGAPVHENIHWYQADIGDRAALGRAFAEIRRGGPVEAVIHLAAHYDFTGVEHGEYERTNVAGLRNVLEECVALQPSRFVFSSSLAACDFHRGRRRVDETTRADGRHVYARTKSIGERMLADYADRFPAAVVRFAALFSDWCEYAPLYMFLQTWLSRSWRARMLAGRGRSAIPYLHVKDAVRMLEAVLERRRELEPGEVLLACEDGCVSHAALFREATGYGLAVPPRALHVPRSLCRAGLHLMHWGGRLVGEPPFERPWMARYIDRQLVADASRTRKLLDWEPRGRLGVLRRLPLLIENQRADPIEWGRRNREALKGVELRPNLTIAWLLDKHAGGIEEAFLRRLSDRREFPGYRRLDAVELQWHVRLLLRHLQSSVRTAERALLVDYCRDLAERRHALGFGVEEVRRALATLDGIVRERLGPECRALGLEPDLAGWVTGTLRFGSDQLEETLEQLTRREPSAGSTPREGP